MTTKKAADREPVFNIRLNADEHMRLSLIGRHMGLETKAAVIRWLIADKWNALRADIAEPKAAPEALRYEAVD